MKADDTLARAARVKAVLMDVDGVLTDGRIYLGAGGEECKAYDVKDGFGIVMGRRAGLVFAIVTGRESASVARRAAEMGIDLVFQGVGNKASCFEEIAGRLSLDPSAIAYVGDDVPDICAMKRCGFAVAVADAHPEAIEAADLVTTRRGGRGAIREVVEIILRAKGVWGELVAGFTNG